MRMFSVTGSPMTPPVLPQIRTMKACSNQNRNASLGIPPASSSSITVSEKLVWNWSSDVADQDTGRFIAHRFLREFLAADWLR